MSKAEAVLASSLAHPDGPPSTVSKNVSSSNDGSAGVFRASTPTMVDAGPVEETLMFEPAPPPAASARAFALVTKSFPEKNKCFHIQHFISIS
jgi:hypothetical protein